MLFCSNKFNNLFLTDILKIIFENHMIFEDILPKCIILVPYKYRAIINIKHQVKNEINFSIRNKLRIQ